MAKLTFHGAAGTVTGSKYLLEVDGASMLVDCGLFQGLKKLRLKNWDPLPLDVSTIDAVVLTHAHLDHVGYLPRLLKLGFNGPIYCTSPTADLAELILFDSAKIQEDDAEYANRKGYSKHKPALPLYTTHDVTKVLKLIETVKLDTWFNPTGAIWCRYEDAGHLLGSGFIEVELRTGSRPTRIVFSGDVGRYDAPLYHDPTPPPECDYLMCESTYGNRDHPEGNLLDELCDVVLESIRRGGVMLVASFAVGRAQQLLYLLHVLMKKNRIPELPVFIDSPMAVDATNIYHDHHDQHDLSEYDLSPQEQVFKGRNVHLSRTVNESKRINDVPGPAVIISSSGMMTAGRILHHLRKRLPDERNTIVLGGFMATGTRGRKLKDGAETLRMHGRDIPVKAHLAEISGLSGHAGRSELLRWLSQLPDPRRTFITHGEPDAAASLAEELKEQRGWNVHVPKLGESVDLETEA